MSLYHLEFVTFFRVVCDFVFILPIKISILILLYQDKRAKHGNLQSKAILDIKQHWARNYFHVVSILWEIQFVRHKALSKLIFSDRFPF